AEEVSLQEGECFATMTSLRKNRRQVIRRGQQVTILTCDLQRFVTIARSRHEDCRKHEVVRILRIECQSFLRVSIALDEIAFGVPVDGEIAIRERERKLGD